MKQVEVAKKYGISKQAVNKQVKNGLLEVDKDGNVNEQQANNLWGSSEKPVKSKSKKVEKEKSKTLNDLKTEQAIIDLKIKKLNYEKETGLIIKKSELKSVLSQHYTAVKLLLEKNNMQFFINLLAKIKEQKTDTEIITLMKNEYTELNKNILLQIAQAVKTYKKDE